MTSKQEIIQLAKLCAVKGIKKVVFSPGSRNAPLVIAFNAIKEIECICIVDERSAAFFALGIAQHTRQTVAIVCTSGTAALNYAPAIAEAYYQELPLLVLTADRPSEWIDQADMQSIRQHNIFANYIKKSFQYPQDTSAKDKLWFAERTVVEAINITQLPAKGPVHINVPFTEPLYDLVEKNDLPEPKNIQAFEPQKTLSKNQLIELSEIWRNANKILIIVGLNADKSLNNVLSELSKQKKVLVMTESCSNLSYSTYLPAIDRFIDTITEEEKQKFQPNLVVTIGGMIVSKKIKVYLRNYKPEFHWSIRNDYKHQDTFKQLTHLLNTNDLNFLLNLKDENDDDFEEDNWQSYKYYSNFKKLDDLKARQQEYFLTQCKFCDFKVVQKVIEHQPPNSIFQWGNSTPVRYANLFEIDKRNVLHYANRGVGGIDGAMSTAAGFAYSCNTKIVTHVTGDLAFFYDSNALWNKFLPNNLRIILINNSGGNIFRIIPGPQKSGHLENFFEHKHAQTAEKICEAFDVDYHFCDNEKDLVSILNLFYNPSEKAKLIEIKTDGEYSAKVLKHFFEVLRNSK